MSTETNGSAPRDGAADKSSAANGSAAGKTTTLNATAVPAPPPLPMFYKNPRPLEVRVHSKVSLKRDIGFGFARHTNSIPLTAPEFPAAATHYPIVFATHPAPVALAVVGLNPTENLFIDAGDRWQGSYIPAYVRRYPFIFLEINKGEQLALCIDESGNALEPGTERPLFDSEGKQTEAVENALKFCIAYQQNHQATIAFVQALIAQDLLVERNASIELATGQKINLAGFRVVDEQRFNALPDDVYLDWRKRGWIGLVFAHLLSTSGWSRLGERIAARTASAKPN